MRIPQWVSRRAQAILYYVLIWRSDSLASQWSAQDAIWIARDRRLRATLLPKRRDVWLLMQNHLKRDSAARVAIDWVRGCFQELSRG